MPLIGFTGFGQELRLFTKFAVGATGRDENGFKPRPASTKELSFRNSITTQFRLQLSEVIPLKIASSCLPEGKHH